MADVSWSQFHYKIISDGSLSSSSPSPSDSTGKHQKSNIGIIVGPVVAVVAVIAFAVAALLWFRRRRRRTSTDESFQPPPTRFEGKSALSLPPSDIVTPRPYTHFYETLSRSDVTSAAVTSSTNPSHAHVLRPSGSQISSTLPAESSQRDRPSVDIDEIMERIAQRIDVSRDENATLPQYRG